MGPWKCRDYLQWWYRPQASVMEAAASWSWSVFTKPHHRHYHHPVLDIPHRYDGHYSNCPNLNSISSSSNQWIVVAIYQWTFVNRPLLTQFSLTRCHHNHTHTHTNTQPYVNVIDTLQSRLIIIIIDLGLNWSVTDHSGTVTLCHKQPKYTYKNKHDTHALTCHSNVSEIIIIIII